MNIFGVQEAIFEAGLKGLGDVDHLDPGVRGDFDDLEARIDAIDRQLRFFNVSDSVDMRHAIAKAIIERNNAMLKKERELLDDQETDPMEDISIEGSGSNIPGIRVSAWDDSKLIRLRTEIYQLNRKYRKEKKKFDLAVVEAIFLEDLEKCHLALLPWPNVWRTLYETWKSPIPETCPWKGMISPVRRGGGGVHLPALLFKWRNHKYELQGASAVKFEIIWFVWTRYFSRAIKVLALIICTGMTIIVLWSEVSVSPVMGLQTDSPQRGSILLLSVCTGAAVPPTCQRLSSPSKSLDTPYFVTSTVQNIIVLHLFYLCAITHFSLTRMRVLWLYEVVAGETDAFSILFHAYIVCRLAPSIAQNYLNVVHEAHEKSFEARQVTVFEQTFSAMGTVPFIGASFNEVCPPIILIVFLVTLLRPYIKRFGIHIPYLDKFFPKPIEGNLWNAYETISEERLRYGIIRGVKSSIMRRGGSSLDAAMSLRDVFGDALDQGKEALLQGKETFCQGREVMGGALRVGAEILKEKKHLAQESIKAQGFNAPSWVQEHPAQLCRDAKRMLESSVSGFQLDRVVANLSPLRVSTRTSNQSTEMDVVPMLRETFEIQVEAESAAPHMQPNANIGNGNVSKHEGNIA